MVLSTLRSLLFGSAMKAVGTVVIVLVVGLGIAAAAGVLGAPSVESVDNHFGTVTHEETEIRTNVTVQNPNPIGVGLDDVSLDYQVRMNDIEMATGDTDDLAIGSGESALEFTTVLDNRRIPEWWASHLQNDERTDLVVHADVHSGTLNRTTSTTPAEREISTDIASAFDSEETREIDADGMGERNPVLYLNETRGDWGDVSEEETPIEMEFDVYNPNEHPVTVTELEYDVEMNGLDVGAGETDKSHVIGPGERTTITATTVIDNDRLDEWWVSHLDRNQRTELSIDFYLTVELTGTSVDLGGDETVRVRLETVTTEFETDVFGNKDEYPTTVSEPAANESASDDEAATPDGEETATPTDTPTPGEDDDDGLLGDTTEEDTPSPTPDDTPTPAPDETPTSTPTDTPEGDDDGIVSRHSSASIGVLR